MDTNKYPNTTWNPHERRSRRIECDYENDACAKNIRTYKMHGEATAKPIAACFLPFRYGSESMVNETIYE